ncbi:hypothetical protein B0H14DRAFT_3609804 [Mycena olivaceomarginata]|nr:hypothetical protein B0H14DRAFT_3609804 [Mycena olivaceomarginata]
MQEGGGHRGSATQDSDGNREDNGEDKLPRPLRSALAGLHSESECNDQSLCWDISEHSWLCEDEDQPLQDLKRHLKSCHATANSVAMLVDGSSKSKLSLPPSPGPAPQPIPLLHCPAAGAQFQPANQCGWIRLLAQSGLICQASTTAAAASSSSAGPPNATLAPPNPCKDSGMLYSIKNPQPISWWYEVDNTIFGHLVMKGPAELPADDAASGAPLPPADDTAFSTHLLPMDAFSVPLPASFRLPGPLPSAVSSAGLSIPPPPADDAPLLPTDDTALGTPPPASFGLPGPLAGLPTMSVGPTALALPTPSAPIMPATVPIVPAAPAIPFDPAALVLAVVQIDQFMAAFKGYSIEDLAAVLQNIKK